MLVLRKPLIAINLSELWLLRRYSFKSEFFEYYWLLNFKSLELGESLVIQSLG